MRRSLALVFLLLAAAVAQGQEFPSRPVRLVVPFPPGGPLDISGRLIGKELQDRWGQPVVIENKPGSTVGPEFTVGVDDAAAGMNQADLKVGLYEAGVRSPWSSRHRGRLSSRASD